MSEGRIWPTVYCMQNLFLNSKERTILLNWYVLSMGVDPFCNPYSHAKYHLLKGESPHCAERPHKFHAPLTASVEDLNDTQALKWPSAQAWSSSLAFN